MRTKKSYEQRNKRTYRPEITHCVDCGSRLRRAVTISDRTIITRKEVLHVVHRGYRCPLPECPGHQRLYRSSEADTLALPGFTFGLDILLFIGHLRLREHKTVDEIHAILNHDLARVEQTISRREILFLIEAYAALVRAASEVAQDEEWKAQVRENQGLLLSIDGIQPDNGNETIYLVRDVWTGRLLAAENVTDSTKERLKQVLAPVVALELPVVGVISDAQPTELQAVADLWPHVPHQICQFHAIREAGRLIYVADHQVRNAVRIRLQQKTHEYRQDLHKRLKAAEARGEANALELEQFQVLEEYAATVEGALNLESITPFQYGGLAMQEALQTIQTSIEKLVQKGGQ
jgi:hypothetical protein